jgi:hypothetical protein
MGILSQSDTRFGIREVCDLKFTRVSGTGPAQFTIDTAKMTTLEGAANTVYAQGGQGNARRMAWEGEKTVTFTVEDALLTKASFAALTGATETLTTGGTKYTIKPTSFAGTYTVTAYTFVRDDDGKDHLTTIIIPKAKLQTTLNLSMSPSGDPSTFTFTFDALAGKQATESDDYLFSLEIKDKEYADGDLTNTITNTYVTIGNETKTVTGSSAVTLSVTSEGAVSVDGQSFSTKFGTGHTMLTDGVVSIAKGGSTTLKAGSASKWYLI